MEAPEGGEPNWAFPAFTPARFTCCIGCGPQDGGPLNVETNKIVTAPTLGNRAVTVTFIGLGERAPNAILIA